MFGVLMLKQQKWNQSSGLFSTRGEPPGRCRGDSAAASCHRPRGRRVDRNRALVFNVRAEDVIRLSSCPPVLSSLSQIVLQTSEILVGNTTQSEDVSGWCVRNHSEFPRHDNGRLPVRGRIWTRDVMIGSRSQSSRKRTSFFFIFLSV